MPNPRYIVTRRFAPWLREVNAVLGRLRDAGFVEHFLFKPLPLRALPDFQKGQSTTASAEKPLGFDRFFVSFVLVAVGLVVGVVVLVYERFAADVWF